MKNIRLLYIYTLVLCTGLNHAQAVDFDPNQVYETWQNINQILKKVRKGIPSEKTKNKKVVQINRTLDNFHFIQDQKTIFFGLQKLQSMMEIPQSKYEGKLIPKPENAMDIYLNTGTILDSLMRIYIKQYPNVHISPFYNRKLSQNKNPKDIYRLAHHTAIHISQMTGIPHD